MLRSGPQTAISHVQTELLGGELEFSCANARSRPLSIYTLDNPYTPFSVSNTVDPRRDADVNYFRGFSSEFPNHLRSSIKHCA